MSDTIPDSKMVEFSDNPVLFGADPGERIVAVEQAGDGEVVVHRRNSDGTTTPEQTPFAPFAWSAEGTVDDEPLGGDLALRFIRRFRGWKHFQNSRTAHRNDAVSTFSFSDPVQQYLTVSGQTLFKGMVFDDLRRLQIAIEPHGEAAIALRDNSGWAVEIPLATDAPGPAVEELTSHIIQRDPDVIEGHNLFKTILPLCADFAKSSKQKLAWGRDGSPVRTRSSRLQIAEKTIQYPRASCHGRHFVDTYLLAQFYDVGTRELENFELETVADHFHIETGPDSSPVQRTAQICAALAATLSASYFVQAQIFPYSYQDVIIRGNATKIDALFLREYFRQRHSVPEPPEVTAFEGGYTDVFFTGLAENVWHCDVTSLYPSVILRFDYLPVADRLGIFRELLSTLRQYRLTAKQEMRSATDENRRRHFSALQNTFKILINSFYGYLGFAQGHFADFAAASAVTAKGRELLSIMVERLEALGSRVIEIDTDGIYFQPPEGATVDQLDGELTKALPGGIDVDFDEQYPAMFSYKAKNYALLESDGSIVLKGAALKSRGMEPFLRDFLYQLVELILTRNAAHARQLRDQFARSIETREWPITKLAKTEFLQDSPASYQKKIAAASRNRSAAFELALRSPVPLHAGDPVTYYITGTRKKVVAYESARLVGEWNPVERDENTAYYVGKLDELFKKFEEFVPEPPGTTEMVFT